MNPSRETKFSGTYGDMGIFIFPVQLATSRIGNLTRLINTLLYVMTIHTYKYTYHRGTRLNATKRFCICSYDPTLNVLTFLLLTGGCSEGLGAFRFFFKHTFYFLFFSERAVWWVGGGMLPDFFFCSFFPAQQTTSGIGHRVN